MYRLSTYGLRIGLYLAAAIIMLTGCASGSDTSLEEFDIHIYEPSYAGGFEILGADGMESTIIVTLNPWQNAGSGKYLFIRRNGEDVPKGFKGQVLDEEASRIVCMSTSYTAMLDFLGESGRVAAVSGKQFVYNSKIARSDIADVGYDGNTDYEAMLVAHPDLVLLYGVVGASSMEQKLEELGIPYMYIGEYLEENPLGKAEWMVVLGEVIGKRDRSISAFNLIPQRYNSLKDLVSGVSSKPRIMVNTPYSDSWLMSPPNSYMGRLIRDAGGDYLYKTEDGNKSLTIDMEQAYAMVEDCDIWINAGNATTMSVFKEILPKFADTKAVRNHCVYTNTLRLGEGGGNDFWESGIVHPDLILEDMINIFHPGLLDNTELNYYRRLE